MKSSLALKSILSTILLPGVSTVFIPYLILVKSGAVEWPAVSILNILAFIAGLLGTVVLLQCICSFAVHGKGTLAPIDPPKQLVVCGIYRHTRNPMYLAVMAMLLSEAVLFRSMVILVYALAGLVILHVFVVEVEEPKLRRLFGQGYIEYCRSVPRWGFVRRPFG
jgi:protein-S-isoprenylcysteine O-methyltransferase Ste14